MVSCLHLFIPLGIVLINGLKLLLDFHYFFPSCKAEHESTFLRRMDFFFTFFLGQTLSILDLIIPCYCLFTGFDICRLFHFLPLSFFTNFSSYWSSKIVICYFEWYSGFDIFRGNIFFAWTRALVNVQKMRACLSFGLLLIAAGSASVGARGKSH